MHRKVEGPKMSHKNYNLNNLLGGYLHRPATTSDDVVGQRAAQKHPCIEEGATAFSKVGHGVTAVVHCRRRWKALTKLTVQLLCWTVWAINVLFEVYHAGKCIQRTMVQQVRRMLYQTTYVINRI